MANFREIEVRYNPPIPQGNVVTHITTPDTFAAINQTHLPAQDKPTLLAVRQSRSISGPLGVNVACNGGPFIYTFNHPAEHFVTTRSGELTIEGIQEKAGTNELMLLELDVSEQSKTVPELPRYLPLQLDMAQRIIAILDQSDTGNFLKQTFLEALAQMKPEQLAHLQLKRDAARMFRAIVTSTAYAIGKVTNFALYGPRIAQHLFTTGAVTYRKAGHGYISGRIPGAALENVEAANAYFEAVVAAYVRAEEVEQAATVSLPEVYESLAEFFDPEYYGLAHTSLEMFLDLDFKSFYWLVDLLREYANITPVQIEQMQLYIHSLYHFLLVENIYDRHVITGNSATQLYKTYEPNGNTENFTILSPGTKESVSGTTYQLTGKSLTTLGQQQFGLAHDYPLPVTQTTLPGLEQLGVADPMSELQDALVEQRYMVPNRRF